nr:hypothetical protein [uncultured Flavobacterium sp.]
MKQTIIPRHGFVHTSMEVNGEILHVQSINSTTVTARKDGKLQRFPLTSVNKMDLARARHKMQFGTL